MHISLSLLVGGASLQVSVQVFLSACRLIMVVVMVGTTAAAYTSTVPVFGEQAGQPLQTCISNLLIFTVYTYYSSMVCSIWPLSTTSTQPTPTQMD